MNGVYYGYALQVIRKNKENHLKTKSCQGSQPECIVSSCLDYKTIPTNTRNIIGSEQKVKALEYAVVDKLTVFDNLLDIKNYV